MIHLVVMVFKETSDNPCCVAYKIHSVYTSNVSSTSIKVIVIERLISHLWAVYMYDRHYYFISISKRVDTIPTSYMWHEKI
jgi:hypothetical protein